jgi:outer membrane receptor protein involved in Fe transport
LQGAFGPVTAWADVSFVSGIYLDEANFYAAPERTLVGVGALVRIPWARGLAASLTVSNLLDQRYATVVIHQGRDYPIVQPIEDFVGYPLPGRAFFATVQYTFGASE